MPTIRRRIDGPQDFHEQRGGEAFRDTRRVSQQVSDLLQTGFSAVGLVGLSVLTVAVPASVTLALPLALGYAAYVMTRPVILPLRLPRGAKGRDFGNPVPDPKRPGVDIPSTPSAGWLIGWDENTGQQLWVSGDDMTMHGLLPGATGAGKTQFIYSLLCNALAQGTGFTLVDGKASNSLIFSVMAMARRWGREADVRVLNFMVASGDRKTNTWNPFNSVNAEGLTELLLILFLPETASGGDNPHFRNRARALIRGMAYVFIWVRDRLGITLTAETIQVMFSDLNRLRALYQERIFSFYDQVEQTVKTVPLPDYFDRALLKPVHDYVLDTGGFTPGKDVSEQDKVREQHSYVVSGFGDTLTQMSSTFGHVFGVEFGDIDFYDVIFNRRILVVLLPSLENHPDTNAALGKAVITALRYALAPALGTSIEGQFEDLVLNRPSSSDVPYPIVLDEVGQYATRGIDAIIALGRELNVSVQLSFQELGTLYANLGRDRAVPLLGNPKLKIFMNMEDSGPTRQWVEEAGGTMPVSVLPGFENSSPLGLYAGQQRADIRDVKRVSWSDIQRLDRGQAIVLFRGRRIYMRMFYAGILGDGKNRVFPTLKRQRILKQPPEKASHLETIAQCIAAGADLIRDGDLASVSEPLRLVCERLAKIIDHDSTPLQDARDLLDMLPDGEVPVSPIAAIFINRVQPTAQLPRTTEPLHASIDRSLCEELVAFDVATGAEPQAARESVVHALNLFARGQETREGDGKVKAL